jgi:RsiW-degrading membrane proteinase PrsW (M82 family)
MIYMENVLICLCAPLVIGALLLKGEARRFIVFYGIGILLCLLAAYINGHVASLAGVGYPAMSATQIMVQITPICEELLKAIPVFVFAAIFSPKRREIVAVALAVGLGFATFENIGFIMQHGAENIGFVLIRGFSAGVAHTVCAAILGYGFAALYRRGRLLVPGAFALLCLACTYHGIYNLLVSSDDAWRAAGFAMPLVTAVAILLVVLWKGNSLRLDS